MRTSITLLLGFVMWFGRVDIICRYWDVVSVGAVAVGDEVGNGARQTWTAAWPWGDTVAIVWTRGRVTLDAVDVKPVGTWFIGTWTGAIG